MLEIFANRLANHGDRLAVVTANGDRRTYLQLAEDVEDLAADLAQPGRLVIVEAANRLECLTAYLACLCAGCPAILVEPGSTAADHRMAECFGVDTVFRESDSVGWRIHEIAPISPRDIHSDLCILLSTSGSTGSPKLVRLSRANIESNAESIVGYLKIQPDDRAITSLPPFYSFGMSVLNSHLLVGAALLMTEESVASDHFWEFFKKQRGTCLSGVPFTFDVLERMNFRARSFPSLRYLAQAGGRLRANRVIQYGEWAKSVGKELFVMYGQTEAAPRMAYVPPGQILDNPECIGAPIPKGEFELLDDAGRPVDTPDQPGELVYRGPNVMMGYAESAADLSRGSDVDALRTGDIACRKHNGLYYIVGRKGRFSKILGRRVSLDDIETWLHSRGWQGIVTGDDSLIAIAILDGGISGPVSQAIADRFGLPLSSFHIVELDEFPTLASGKVNYRAVLQLAAQASERLESRSRNSLLDIYRHTLGVEDVRPADSFLDLGGDSVSFVALSLEIEGYLGNVPENWEVTPIQSLEALKTRAKGSADDGAQTQGPTGFLGFIAKHPFRTAALCWLALLLAGELTLQMRAYVLTGRNAAVVLAGKSKYVINEEWGLKTYRPNLVIPTKDRNAEKWRINSLGFRGAEINRTPASDELRLAIVGASTVAGAYANSNAETFPSLIEQRLREQMPSRNINVINAGVGGYRVSDIESLVERAVIGLRPDIVLVYTGLNDTTKVCSARSTGRSLDGLWAPKPPGWMLTRTLIGKNTVALRSATNATAVDPTEYFPSSYVTSLERIVATLKTAGIDVALVTIARSYVGVDPETQRELASDALFFFPCLNLAGMVQVGNLFNDTIRSVARRESLPLIDLAAAIPGGSEYFFDAMHLSLKGEIFTAEFIVSALYEHEALSRHLKLPQQRQ